MHIHQIKHGIFLVIYTEKTEEAERKIKQKVYGKVIFVIQFLKHQQNSS